MAGWLATRVQIANNVQAFDDRSKIPSIINSKFALAKIEVIEAK
jgi:hypothetical protein